MLDVERAFSKFCEGGNCSSCPFDTIVPADEDCRDFAQRNPEEAMQIMGLEDEDDKEDEHFEFNEDAFKDLMGGAICLNA